MNMSVCKNLKIKFSLNNLMKLASIGWECYMKLCINCLGMLYRIRIYRYACSLPLTPSMQVHLMQYILLFLIILLQMFSHKSWSTPLGNLLIHIPSIKQFNLATNKCLVSVVITDFLIYLEYGVSTSPKYKRWLG